MGFNAALRKTLGIEGGFSNHEDDLGGATRYGITEAVAKEYGYEGPMEQIPKEVARRIYRDRYWNALRLDQVSAIGSEDLAEELFDTGVNMGTGQAAKFLQRCLNVFNRQQRDWSDVAVDGQVGPVTLEGLKHYMNRRDVDVLIRALNSLQGARYIELAEAREANESFVYGWIRTRVE